MDERLRPSEEVALLAGDFGPARDMLRVSKACVAGVHKDLMKTGDACTLVLCPRALAILGR